MKARIAYEQIRRTGMPRVDMILTVYNAIIERLEQAQQAPADQAEKLVAEARLAVSGLAIGVAQQADEVGVNLLRLYDFVLYCLRQDAARIADALGVMRTLREGFQAIRPQALEMERSGIIPPLDRTHAVQSLA
jgi:flagellin-specific chaperone FliS